VRKEKKKGVRSFRLKKPSPGAQGEKQSLHLKKGGGGVLYQETDCGKPTGIGPSQPCGKKGKEGKTGQRGFSLSLREGGFCPLWGGGGKADTFQTGTL